MEIVGSGDLVGPLVGVTVGSAEIVGLLVGGDVVTGSGTNVTGTPDAGAGESSRYPNGFRPSMQFKLIPAMGFSL